MDDKILLEGILWDLKVLSDLCLHGSIESGAKKINELFKTSLKDILDLQNELFNIMAEEGMYNVTNIEKSKITKAQAKYKQTLEGE